MESNEKNFEEDLQTLRNFLADKRLLGELADRAEAKSRTVQYTFKAKSITELKGKRLKVYIEALNMKRELDAIFSEYTNSENKI